MCTCGNTQGVPAVTPHPVGTRFHVEDMTCAHCAGTIRNALKDGMPGAEFTVDLESQTVTVTGDAAQAEALIREAGYEPKLLLN